MQILKDKRIGYIDALVADKESRGRGVGKSLVDGATLWLEERRCEIIYATADRYNTFIHRDFHLYKILQQIRDYGLSFLRLWLAEFYFIGFGTFFLRRGKDQRKPREIGEAWHFLVALLGMSTVWWIQILRGQGPLMLIPALFAVASVSILVHELSQKFMACRLGLKTIFKAWGSGIFLSWLLAPLGIFFPAYGSTYVKQIDWWHNPKKDKTGVIFAMGPLSSLALGFALWIIRLLAANSLLAELAKIEYITSLSIALLNLIPIQAAGGFVWDGKKDIQMEQGVGSCLL